MATPKPWVWLLSIAMILAAIGYYLGYLPHGHFGNESAARSVALCTALAHSIEPGATNGLGCDRAVIWLHQGNLFLLIALGVLGLMGLIYAIAAITAPMAPTETPADPEPYPDYPE